MSEIRSTIEIMMERTRGMSLSEDEKKRLKKEELHKKAKGYALKLMDPSGLNQSVLSALSEESEETRTVLEKLVWKEIVALISTENDMDIFFDRFQSWPFVSSRKTEIEHFRTIFKQQSKNKNKDRKAVLEREKKKLADAGISGTAVVPKFSREMGTAVFEEILQDFKKSISID